MLMENNLAQKSHTQQINQIDQMIKRVSFKLDSLQDFQYSKILHERVDRFSKDYAQKTNQCTLQHLKESYKLSLRYRSQLQPIAITQSIQTQQSSSKKSRLSDPNIFCYSFQLPCKYETYQTIIKDTQIQMKIDDIITKYEVIQTLAKTDNLSIQLMYLSYKRMLIMAPRQFVYVRMFFKDLQLTSEKSSINWIITFSVPQKVQQSDKTRAEIILTVQKIEYNTKENMLMIRVFSEIDMKTSVKSQMAKNKGFAEIKKYVQKIYDYSKLLQK